MEDLQQTPKRLGRYQVKRLLGEGAMGRVYLGWDPQIGRMVAVKTVRTDLRLSDRKKEEFLTRFSREARAAGRLSHPNIVGVFDIGREQGLPWIAMEYVDGKSLKDLKRKGLPPLPSNVLWLADRISAALDAAHKSGVIHRDIKPANILVSKAGEVKVTDFGIARIPESDLTREGVMLGSPSYMSPEQVRGKGVHNSGDFFSTAVILYEWMTGHRPFDGNDLATITHKIVYEEFTLPSKIKSELGANLDQFFLKALAKKPEDRFNDGREMVDALREALQIKQGAETTLQTVTGAVSSAEPSVQNSETTNPQEPASRVSRSGDSSRSDSTEIQTILPTRVEGLFVDISRGSGRGSARPKPQNDFAMARWWAALLGLAALAAVIGWLVQ